VAEAVRDLGVRAEPARVLPSKPAVGPAPEPSTAVTPERRPAIRLVPALAVIVGLWLMSRAGRMNAVAVFVSLLFWGWIWGVWGLFLAVPIMAAATAVCERIDDLNSYAELLKE
jgi:hypothetical protein